MIKITETKVYPIRSQDSDRKLKAYATIVLDNCFIVRDLKVIIRNDGGLFVSMPSRKSKFGSFRDIAHPLNSDMRNEIEKSVIAEYHNAIKNHNSDDHYDVED